MIKIIVYKINKIKKASLLRMLLKRLNVNDYANTVAVLYKLDATIVPSLRLNVLYQ